MKQFIKDIFTESKDDNKFSSKKLIGIASGLLGLTAFVIDTLNIYEVDIEMFEGILIFSATMLGVSIVKGFTKKSRTYKLLGCNWVTFKNYLENNPYGFTINCNNLDLDHIVPTSSAKTEEELIELSHYTNFQLLPSKYNQNIKRNNNFNKDHFEKWLENNKNNEVAE